MPRFTEKIKNTETNTKYDEENTIWWWRGGVEGLECICSFFFFFFVSLKAPYSSKVDILLNISSLGLHCLPVSKEWD